MSQIPSRAVIGSFDKGLRVIKSFDADHVSMTLSEVAERTQLTRAGARRFLYTLVAGGYADFDGKHFELTPRVLELGFAYLRSLRLPAVALPFLRQLSERLGESSSVSVLDGPEVVYVARVQTRRIMSADLGVGARLPAICTSMGRVLLAALPEAERATRVKQTALVAHTKHTLVDRARLRTLLKAIGQKGFCIVDQELEEGLRSIAVPLRNQSGEVLAAMNISAQANRVGLDTLKRVFLPALQATAEEIARVVPA